MSGRYQNKGKHNFKSSQGEKTGANADKWVKNVQNDSSPDKYSSDSQGGKSKHRFTKEKNKKNSSNNSFPDSGRTKMFVSSSTSNNQSFQNNASIPSQNQTINFSATELSGENNSNKNRNQVKTSRQFKKSHIYKEVSPLEFSEKAKQINESEQNTVNLQVNEMTQQEKSIYIPIQSMTNSPHSQKSYPNDFSNSLLFVEKDTSKQRNVVTTSSSLDHSESAEMVTPQQQNAFPSSNNQQYNIDTQVDTSTNMLRIDNPNPHISVEQSHSHAHLHRYSASNRGEILNQTIQETQEDKSNQKIENDESQDSGLYYKNYKGNVNIATDNTSSNSQTIKQNYQNMQSSNSTFNNTAAGIQTSLQIHPNQNGNSQSNVPSGGNFQNAQSKRAQNQAKEHLIYQEKIEENAYDKANPRSNVSEQKNQKQMRQTVEKQIVQMQESNKPNQYAQVDQVASSSSSENTTNVSKIQRSALKMDQKQRESFIQFEIKMPSRSISLYIDENHFKEDKMDLVISQQLRPGNFDNLTEIEIKMQLINQILKNIFDKSIKLDEASFSESVEVSKLLHLIRHYNDIRFPSPQASNSSSQQSSFQQSSQTGVQQQQQMQGQTQMQQMQVVNGINVPIIQNSGIPPQYNNGISNSTMYMYPNNNYYPQSQQNYQSMLNPYYQQQYFGNQQQYPQGQKPLRNQYIGPNSYTQSQKKSTQGSYKSNNNLYSNMDEEKN